MLRQIIILVLSTVILTSCSLNPPSWLHGQWTEKKDSLNSNGLVTTWDISKSGVYHKTNVTENHETKSTSMITITEINEPTRYVLRIDHAAESQPYFQVFKLKTENEILYYDSSSILPKKEYTLTRTK